MTTWTTPQPLVDLVAGVTACLFLLLVAWFAISAFSEPPAASAEQSASHPTSDAFEASVAGNLSVAP